MNPHDHLSRSRLRLTRQLWAAVLAAAALATSVAWAATPAIEAKAALTTAKTGHMAPAEEHLSLTEAITLDSPSTDEYELTATLHLRGEDGKDAGPLVVHKREISVSDTVTTGDDERTIALPLELDATDLAGKTVVAYVTLSKDGFILMSREDIADDDQAMRFPKVSTTLAEAGDGRELLGDGSTAIHTTVAYDNLEPGRKYDITVTALDAEMMEPIDDPTPMATATLKPEKSSGQTEVDFTIGASRNLGRSIRLETALSIEDNILARHLTPEDESLTIPRLAATAHDELTGTATASKRADATFVEEVRYEGLIPGTTYVITGTVRNGETGARLLDGDNNPIEGTETSREFTPTEPNGSVELAYHMDTTALSTPSVTFAVTVTRKDGGRTVATHDGLSDGTCVTFYDMEVTAVGGHTAIHAEPARHDATILASITYHNLVPGAEYEAIGTLLVADSDASVSDEAGNEVNTSTAFVAEDTEGSVPLLFDVDTTNLAGKSLVARCAILLDSTEVAAATSGSGPVRIPKASLKATDARTGLHEAPSDGTLPVKATLTCENVPTDAGLTASVTLLDALTGEVVCDIGETPIDAPDGNVTVDLTAEIDAMALRGRGVTALASVLADGCVIASCGGLGSDAATIHLPTLAATLTDPATDIRVASTTGGRTKLISSVSYDGLIVGETHEVRAKLVDLDTDKPVKDAEGNEATSTASIKPDQPSGSLSLSFELPTKKLAGHTVVLAADVTYEGSTTATFDGKADHTARMRIAKAGVTAVGKASGDQELPATEKAEAILTISYANLEPGHSYLVTTTIADDESGKVLEDATRDAELKPDRPDGTMEIPITFDARKFAGKSLMAHAVIAFEESVVATSGKRPDGKDTLHVPSIRTTLHVSGSDAHEVDAKSGTKLTDTITYTNLTPGVEYVITGELVDAQTGKSAIASVAEKGTTAATSASESSTTSKEQAKDAFADKPDATTVWVSEDSTYHLDKACENAKGTLRRTTLGIAKAASKTACPKESGVDTKSSTSSSNTTGNESQSKGAASARQEERPSTATAKFTPKEASGTVDVEFSIDTTGLEGKRLVSLQTLTRDRRTVTEHRDISDADQTVTVTNAGITDGSESMGQTGTGFLPFVAIGAGIALAITGAAIMLGRKSKGDDDEHSNER